jgi:hypothetical protein
MDYTNEQLLELIPNNAYPEDVQHVLDTLFIKAPYDNKQNKIFVVGSYSFRIQPFPSDIDCMNIFLMKETPIDKMIDLFIKKIQDMAKLIKQSKDIYFMDFKAGTDYRYFPSDYELYEIDDKLIFEASKDKLNINSKLIFRQNDLIGELRTGKIKNYNYKKLKAFTTNLISKKMIKGEDAKILLDNIKPKIDFSNMETIYATLKEYFTIRWTIKDILNGSKELRDGTIMTLKQALMQYGNKDNVVKIDVASYINNRWLEISNIYIIAQENMHKNLFTFNTYLLSDIEMVRSLKKEINNFVSLPSKYSPLKLAKRLWSYARATKNKKMLKDLYPLIISGVALVGQINSEVDMILNVINKNEVTEEMLNKMKYQINGWKYRISKNVTFKIDEAKMFKYIDVIYSSVNIKNITELLSKLYDMNKSKIDDFSIKYLTKVKLYPVPYKIINIKD